MDDTLVDVLAGHRRAGRGDRLALVDQRRSVTYAELERDVTVRVRELRSTGVGPGTRTGITLTSSLDSVVDFAAATSLHAAVLVLQERAGEAERSAALTDFGAELGIDAMGVTRLRPPRRGRGDPAFAVTSSGTSGRPKVISREWSGTLHNSATFARGLGIDADDVVLTTSPLGHSYAIEAGTLAALSAGACQVIPSGPLTPARAAALAERHRPTVLQSVPLILDWWGRGGVPHAGSWQRCVSAGEALPAQAVTAWHDAGITVYDHYGNSELGQLTLHPAGGGGSVGHPLPGVKLKAGGDEPGPVVACFPGLSPVRMEEGHPVPLADDEGWVATGDLGVLDDGGLRLTGRSDLIINIGGNKVSPSKWRPSCAPCPGSTTAPWWGGRGPPARARCGRSSRPAPTSSTRRRCAAGRANSS